MSVVAYGLAPIPGDDGRIVELVPREPPQTAPQEGAQGLVDYRSSSYTNIIHEGDVICDIIPPSPGTSGVDIASSKAVLGRRRMFHKGKTRASVRMGSIW